MKKQSKKQLARFTWEKGDVKITKPGAGSAGEWTKYGKARKA